MGYSKDEIILILSNTLERLKNDPEQFDLFQNSAWEYTIVLRGKNEIKIKVNYADNSHIEVYAGEYWGRIKSSLFSPSWWKAYSTTNKIIHCLQNKEEMIEKEKRMAFIYNAFPELMTKEFEKEVLK